MKLTPEKLGENPSEYSQQVALFAWAQQNREKYPELALLFAIKNEEKSGSKIAGARFKAAGVKSGVPDIMLPVARQKAHGLFIELKKPGGTDKNGKHVARGVVSAEQSKWQARLQHEGYWAVTCWGWEDARDALVSYLDQN